MKYTGRCQNDFNVQGQGLPQGTRQVRDHRVPIGLGHEDQRLGLEAPSPGRHCHFTLSLTVIGCHSLAVYTVILLSLLSTSVKMTDSPMASSSRAPRSSASAPGGNRSSQPGGSSGWEGTQHAPYKRYGGA
jgi:hypothetical protein